MSKIQLPDDPKAALEDISGYLRTLSLDPSRAIKEDGEVVGFWQCTEWLEGLNEIADECDRIVQSSDSPNPPQTLKRPTSIGWWFVRNSDGWADGCVARVLSLGDYGKAVIWGHQGNSLKCIEAAGWEWLHPLDIRKPQEEAPVA